MEAPMLAPAVCWALCWALHCTAWPLPLSPGGGAWEQPVCRGECGTTEAAQAPLPPGSAHPEACAWNHE